MVWGFNPYEGDVGWYPKQGIEPELFLIILKKEAGSYNVVSIKNTINELR